MATKQFNIRLSDTDRNRIAELRMEIANRLPPRIAAKDRILSASDVICAAIRYLADNMEDEAAAAAYSELRKEKRGRCPI